MKIHISVAKWKKIAVNSTLTTKNIDVPHCLVMPKAFSRYDVITPVDIAPTDFPSWIQAKLNERKPFYSSRSWLKLISSMKDLRAFIYGCRGPGEFTVKSLITWQGIQEDTCLTSLCCTETHVYEYVFYRYSTITDKFYRMLLVSVVVVVVIVVSVASVSVVISVLVVVSVVLVSVVSVVVVIVSVVSAVVSVVVSA